MKNLRIQILPKKLGLLAYKDNKKVPKQKSISKKKLLQKNGKENSIRIVVYKGPNEIYDSDVQEKLWNEEFKDDHLQNNLEAMAQ